MDAALPFPLEAIEKSVTGRFFDVAKRFASRIALQSQQGSWTYEELEKHSRSLASKILKHGGQRVGVLCEHDMPAVVAILAVLQTGNTYVPLDPFAPRLRNRSIIEDAGMTMLLADEANLVLARELAQQLDILLVSVDDDPAETIPVASPTVSPDSVAYILYTSGTTNRPKGVVQNHRNLLHHIRVYAASLSIVPSDKLSLLPSLVFDASLMDLFGALLTGASVHFWDLRSRGLEELGDWTDKSGITIYHSTPTVFRAFTEQLKDGARLQSLRRVVLGGEKVERRDLSMWRHFFSPTSVFVNGFGPTEATVSSQAFFEASASVPDTVSLGRPVENTEIFLVDINGQPNASEGQIAIRSRHLALEYWNQPEASRAAFLPDPDGGTRRIYLTGDRGRWLADGSLAFIERIGHQVKLHGLRANLGEIEEILRSHPEIRDVAVTATAESSTHLTAYVVLRARETVSSPALRRWLAERIPRALVPRDFCFLPEMPMTLGGKIDRLDLANTTTLDERIAEPLSSSEKRLASIWARTIECEPRTRDSDFFALGGTSLHAAQLAARIRRDFGVEFSLRQLFEASTLGGQASAIDKSPNTGPDNSPDFSSYLTTEKHLVSFAEEQMWILDQMVPGDRCYHLPYAANLKGRLNPAALTNALGQLAGRHDVLSSSYGRHGAQLLRNPVDATIPLKTIDLRDFPAEARTDEAIRIATREAFRPFDLARGPVGRAVLLHLDHDEYMFVLCIHHIAADGVSMGILLPDLSALYLTELNPVSEENDGSTARRVRYQSYACWQRDWLTPKRLEGLLGYWRNQLKGVASLQLPVLDLSKRSSETIRGASFHFTLPANTAAALESLANSNGATSFMILLAAWKTLLCRYTSERDLCVASPVANRSLAETGDVVGCFVNTILVRTDLSGDPSFLELLASVRQVCLDAFDHQALPFALLVQDLKPSREAEQPPLFSTMFAMHNMPPAFVSLGAMEATPVELEAGVSLCDLTLSFTGPSHDLRGRFEYATRLFDDATIEGMASGLCHLLGEIVARPNSRISALQTYSYESQRQLIIEASSSPCEDTSTVHSRIASQAVRNPDAIAAVYEDNKLSYRCLAVASQQLAGELTVRGIGKGDFVPIVAERGLDFVVAIYAVLQTGAAFVPLDVKWPTRRIALALSKIQSSVVILAANPTDEIDLDEVQCLRIDLAASGEVARESVRVDPEDPMYAIFTSGSTGIPKAAIVPHRGINNRFHWMTQRFDEVSPPTTIQTTPAVFDSVVWQLLWPLTLGGKVVIPSDCDLLQSERMATLIQEHQVTMVDFVPSVLEALSPTLKNHADKLSSLSHVLLGGEAVSRTTIQALGAITPNATITNVYGPTEASIGCIAHTVSPMNPGAVPIGLPITGTRALILDQNSQLVPPGVPGELYLAGACVGLGYLGDPTGTRRVFIASPYPDMLSGILYKTGDQVQRRNDGNLEFLGRLDDQVKIRGYRIEPREIEAVLCQHPAVKEAIVVASKSQGSLQLCAYFVASGQPGSVSTLRQFLRERLPAPMLPAFLIPIDCIPIGPGGKRDKRSLPSRNLVLNEFNTQTPKRLASQTIDRTPPADAIRCFSDEKHHSPSKPLTPDSQPKSLTEDIVAQSFSLALGSQVPDKDLSFFDIGGNSLLLVAVSEELEKRLGCPVPIMALFRYPTVRQLAAYLDGRSPTEKAPLPARRSYHRGKARE